MNRFLCCLIILSLPLAMTIFGCVGDTINVLSSQQWPAGIQVTGTGSVFGKPDLVLVNMGVSAERMSVQEARDEAASAMQKVLDALKENGVAEEDIQTQRFNIHPQYDYIEGKRVLRGYVVTNMVSVKIRDLDSVGKIIDDAVTVGGDLLRINSITFTIDDPKELQSKARIEAMKDAKAKAESLAGEGGVKLGNPISISDTAYSTTPRFYDSEESVKVGAATPIEPGLLEVSVTVTVLYDIEEE